VESLAEGVEYNPARLEQVNERLNTIYSLQQKHHVETVEELIALREQLKAQLDAIDNSDENVAELKKKWEELQGQTRRLATELSDRRKKAAAPLQKELEKSLQSLGMPNARITITVEHDEKFAGEDGSDAIQFLFSANKNGEPQNLSQVASGGEIARVMLSLKALIAKEVKLPTIIFDEIDTGVSGSIAEKMAIIMQQMGQSNRQVISITHLPQIAALGTEHYRVYKEDSDDDTTSHIVHLSNEERVKEIAHMLSGETITDAAIENARVLLKETPSNSPRGDK
jgi:DNA repair protein RecN (Recombination protein N)